MTTSFLAGAAIMGANIFLPLFLQIVSGATATRAGLLLAPMMATLTLTSIVAGQMLSRTGRYRTLVRVGPVVVVAGLASLLLLDAGSKPWHATPSMLVLGVGMGMMMPPLSIAVQNGVASPDLGVATASITFFRTLGQTFGVTVFGAVLQAKVVSGLDERVAADQLGGLDVRSLLGSPKAIRELDPGLRDAVVSSVADAVHLVYLVAVPVAVAVLISAWLLRELPLRTTSALADARAAARGAEDAQGEVPAVSG